MTETPDRPAVLRKLASIKKRRAANPDREEIRKVLTQAKAIGMSVQEMAERSGVHIKQIYRSYPEMKG